MDTLKLFKELSQKNKDYITSIKLLIYSEIKSHSPNASDEEYLILSNCILEPYLKYEDCYIEPITKAIVSKYFQKEFTLKELQDMSKKERFMLSIDY